MPDLMSPVPKLALPSGWVLLGQYPLGDPDGVGSWILHHNGEAALLELPPDEALIENAVEVVSSLNLRVKFIFVSHDHEDHFDRLLLRSLRNHPAFESARWMAPKPRETGVTGLSLGGEPLWLVHAPKHSLTDTVTIFRGFAMAGDIELGTLESVNREVGKNMREESLSFLAAFERQHNYRVRGLVSAHLNDFRQDIRWAEAVSGETDV
jgi:hydroxyacylglutathione hydrolase